MIPPIEDRMKRVGAVAALAYLGARIPVIAEWMECQEGEVHTLLLDLATSASRALGLALTSPAPSILFTKPERIPDGADEDGLATGRTEEHCLGRYGATVGGRSAGGDPDGADEPIGGGEAGGDRDPHPGGEAYQEGAEPDDGGDDRPAAENDAAADHVEEAVREVLTPEPVEPPIKGKLEALVFRLLSEAAAEGRACPSNAEMVDGTPWAPSSALTAIRSLIDAKRIIVATKRDHVRVVTICATGHSTADPYEDEPVIAPSRPAGGRQVSEQVCTRCKERFEPEGPLVFTCPTCRQLGGRKRRRK